MMQTEVALTEQELRMIDVSADALPRSLREKIARAQKYLRDQDAALSSLEKLIHDVKNGRVEIESVDVDYELVDEPGGSGSVKQGRTGRQVIKITGMRKR